jgi:hypothetical protein
MSRTGSILAMSHHLLPANPLIYRCYNRNSNASAWLSLTTRALGSPAAAIHVKLTHGPLPFVNKEVLVWLKRASLDGWIQVVKPALAALQGHGDWSIHYVIGAAGINLSLWLREALLLRHACSGVLACFPMRPGRRLAISDHFTPLSSSVAIACSVAKSHGRN